MNHFFSSFFALKNVFYLKRGFFFSQAILTSYIFFATLADAKPCFPSDPDYTNPGNLCPSSPPGSLSADSFRQGEARPVKELPTLINPAGRVIISPSGFWTGSETNSNVRTLRTNNGQIFVLPSN